MKHRKLTEEANLVSIDLPLTAEHEDVDEDFIHGMIHAG